MIQPDLLEQFRTEANKPEYLKYKEQVKRYIEDRYIVSSKSPISVYSVRVGFQMIIGNIPQSALSCWLQEWGYKVDPLNGNSNGHGVYLRIKPLNYDEKEEHYQKEWHPKRKGTIVY